MKNELNYWLEFFEISKKKAEAAKDNNTSGASISAEELQKLVNQEVAKKLAGLDVNSLKNLDVNGLNNITSRVATLETNVEAVSSSVTSVAANVNVVAASLTSVTQEVSNVSAAVEVAASEDSVKTILDENTVSDEDSEDLTTLFNTNNSSPHGGLK